MANKFGPTRADLRIRLWISVFGMLMTGGLVAYRGLPSGPGGWEALGIATVFFGGSALWTVRKLVRNDVSDADDRNAS